MLRTLKWVYDLGIKHERIRIAAQLQAEVGRLSVQRDTAIDMLREHAKMPEKRQHRLEFDMAVNDQVQEIVNTLFRADEQWVQRNSIMFPDREAVK